MYTVGADRPVSLVIVLGGTPFSLWSRSTFFVKAETLFFTDLGASRLHTLCPDTASRRSDEHRRKTVQEISQRAGQNQTDQRCPSTTLLLTSSCLWAWRPRPSCRLQLGKPLSWCPKTIFRLHTSHFGFCVFRGKTTTVCWRCM